MVSYAKQKDGNIMAIEKKNFRLIFSLVIIQLLTIITITFSFSKYSKLIYGGNEKLSKDDDRDLIVFFQDEIDKHHLDEILKEIRDFVEVKRHIGDYALVSVNDKGKYEDIKSYLDKHPSVKIVQQDGSIQLMQVSDDTYAKTQWAIHNPGYYSMFLSGSLREVSVTPDIDMDVAEAWLHMEQENARPKRVVVAIIDTGVDYNHPDLKDNIWINENEIPDDGIDNDNNGYIDDVYGWDFYNDDASVCHYRYNRVLGLNLSDPNDNDDHGTHIAGIIGAVKDNKIGIAGIASNIDIKLMILKINGGKQGSGSISDAIEAIKYATMMGADICNISWGTGQYSPALEEVIKESDMLFVAAAGNSGSDNDTKPIYPANFQLDNLISVTFIDANGNMTKQSNYGKTTIDLAAPGTDILSTVVGTYQTLSGSSMAAPQVSAVAALLYSYDENLYPQAVKNVIINCLKPIAGLSDFIKKPGIPSAYAAVLNIKNAQRDYIAPAINLKTEYNKESFLVSVKAEDEGGSGIRVIRWLPGEKTIEEFGRGTIGLRTENGQVKMAKAGTYTFYVSDYAGNENVAIYNVEDDLTPPTISAGYTVADDYKSRTITVKVKDGQSGVKRVKYMSGKRKAEEFLPAGSGTEIKLKDNKASFKVKKDGYYTIYAIDYRGNQTVNVINVKTIVSEEVKFTRTEKIMNIGEKYVLRAFVKPANTTDVVTYTSSDERIAVINKNGNITALREGTALITARTSNGHKAVCKIIVKKNRN